MSQYSYGSFEGQSAGRQPGARRAKLKGYLRAANELRQSYMQALSSDWDSTDSRSEWFADGSPDTCLDGSVVQGGNQEMILFPSYARRHVKRRPGAHRHQTDESIYPPLDSIGHNEHEPWRQQWEQYEEDNAVVDVDVRGWIFAPHRGSLSRRQRFYFTLARQLAGLPTSTRTPSAGTPSAGTPSGSRSSSPQPSHRDRLEERVARHDVKEASREAEKIIQRGEAESAVAERGGYSENPRHDSNNDAFNDERGRTMSDGGLRNAAASAHLKRTMPTNSIQSDDDPKITPVQQRASWPHPGDMTEAQIHVANGHLMARLRPFISNPSVNTAISAFFYNDEQSRQRTIYTTPSGHFALRAALDFVPTHVRVLVSNNLSATERVVIADPIGVSVISDIDDTIKHTAMTSGAREAFRNAFIRDLDDLTIEGVKEWYTRLAMLGADFHYVSNSPWQLYPTIAKFFSVAGLPPGSVHLKLYSGMLQGIFEPVAERKKSTIDRLARDFPERNFVLIGDSGEADLEIYTDFVIENPGRVLGVFIRDVTTPVNQGVFDSSFLANGDPRRSGAKFSRIDTKSSGMSDSDDDPDLRAAIAASLRQMELEEANRKRPPLPVRRPSDYSIQKPNTEESTLGDLIEFSDDESSTPKIASRISQSPDRLASSSKPELSRIHSDPTLSALRKSATNESAVVQRSIPPLPPMKPVGMRSSGNGHNSIDDHPSGRQSPLSSQNKKTPPPKPRRPSTSVQYQPRDPSPLAQFGAAVPLTKKPAPPPPPTKPSTYASLAKQKISNAYHRLPTPPSFFLGSEPDTATEDVRPITPSASRTTQSQELESSPPSSEKSKPSPPPLPPRHSSFPRPLSSYPAAAAHYASNRVSSAWNAYQHAQQQPPQQQQSSSGTSTTAREAGAQSATPPQAPGSPGVGKKEQLWRQRWMRAEYILRDRGVLLKSWRVGRDVEDECYRLVERALREGKAVQRLIDDE